MISLALLSAAHIHTRGFLETIRKREGCRLVALWDDVEDRGRRYADANGADYSGDLEAVARRADVDGFVICAENTQHLPLLRAAIPAGKPVFCEKPLTTTLAEAREVRALIDEHGTLVHLGYFQPFSAEMQGVIACVNSGVLGKITHARYRNAHNAAYRRAFDSEDLRWFTDPKLAGGGAFMDMGTHAVHLLRTLLGPVREVSASIGNVSGIYPEVDDHGVALLRFESGALATVEASWVQTGGLGGLEIVGSEATLYLLPGSGYVTKGPGRGDPAAVVPGVARPTRIERLCAAIEGRLERAALDADLECAFDAVAVMQSCYASSESGRWTEVPRI